MRRFTVFMAAIGFLLLSANCNKDNPDPNERAPFISGESVFVLSEGVFQQGNASVSHYNKVAREVENRVFHTVNEADLGDVAHSMTIHEGMGYIVVNNSQKIEVVGLDSLARQEMFTGFTSPRYIFPVQSNKAYVTDLASDSVAIIDLSSGQITGWMAIQGSTEEVDRNSQFIFIANNSNEYVYVVDPATDSLIDKVEAIEGMKSIATDMDGDLWVLCGGNSSNNIPPRLFEFDGTTLVQQKDLTLPSGTYASDLTANGTGDTLYYLNQGVYKMPAGASQLPANPLIEPGSRTLYTIGIDPDESHIYVGDAGNFSDNGSVFRYAPGGQLVDSFKVGIAPGYIQFY